MGERMPSPLLLFLIRIFSLANQATLFVCVRERERNKALVYGVSGLCYRSWCYIVNWKCVVMAWVYVVCVHTLIPMCEFGMFVHPVCVHICFMDDELRQVLLHFFLRNIIVQTHAFTYKHHMVHFLMQGGFPAYS